MTFLPLYTSEYVDTHLSVSSCSLSVNWTVGFSPSLWWLILGVNVIRSISTTQLSKSTHCEHGHHQSLEVARGVWYHILFYILAVCWKKTCSHKLQVDYTSYLHRHGHMQVKYTFTLRIYKTSLSPQSPQLPHFTSHKAFFWKTLRYI